MCECSRWKHVGEIVKQLEAEIILGNGSAAAGRYLIAELAKRMGEARTKHPVFAEGRFHALGVVGDEYGEFVQAVLHESPARMSDEALDTAVTALRFWCGEHEVRCEND